MSARGLLHLGSQLLAEVLRFERPADAVLAQFFRARRLGPRERTRLGDAIHAVLRQKCWFAHFAIENNSLSHRKMMILGFHEAFESLEYLRNELSEEEKTWWNACPRQAPPGLDALDPRHHNLPGWLAQRLHGQLGAEFPALVRSLRRAAPLDVRVNLRRGKRAAVRAELAGHGIEAAETPHSPWGLRLTGKPSLRALPLWARGALEVQDEGSQLLALLCAVRRGMQVVDFCAGAGGKTLALGMVLGGTGRLCALETSAARLDALGPRLQRAGLENVCTMRLAHEADARLAPLMGRMDCVLVDAPCSGTGTLRRHPDLAWRQPEGGVADLAARQAAILERAARLPKSGGLLVYATCSLLEEENEAVADAFAAAHPQYTPQSAAGILARGGVPQAQTLCSADGQRLRLWPHRHGTDGFFAAVWQRK